MDKAIMISNSYLPGSRAVAVVVGGDGSGGGGGGGGGGELSPGWYCTVIHKPP